MRGVGLHPGRILYGKKGKKWGKKGKIGKCNKKNSVYFSIPGLSELLPVILFFPNFELATKKIKKMLRKKREKKGKNQKM